VEEVPDAPQDTSISFSRENWGQEIYLPQGKGTFRLFYLPNQVILERGDSKRLPRVVLDAGHGGGDTGVKVGNLSEKDLVLSVVNRIRNNFGGRGVEVVLTRRADAALSLAARAQFASTAQVFVSIHAAAGSRVNIYSFPEVQTLRLLERGRELNSRTPANQKTTLERYVAAPGSAARFAQGISEAFASAGIVANSSQDAMYVLSQAGGAAVLVELGFEQLRTASGRDQAAEILTNAILSYLGLPSNLPKPTPTPPAQQTPQQGGNR
jgi:N-acetylmuramoyl-L-alanine amidase